MQDAVYAALNEARSHLAQYTSESCIAFFKVGQSGPCTCTAFLGSVVASLWYIAVIGALTAVAMSKDLIMR